MQKLFCIVFTCGNKALVHPWEAEGAEMKRISFGAQMLICFVAVVVGHWAAVAFDSPVLFNIASALGGAAFVVYPVLHVWITWGDT